MLTLTNVRDYLSSVMDKPEFISFHYHEDGGQEFIDAKGYYGNDEIAFNATCWIENGKVYGEW